MSSTSYLIIGAGCFGASTALWLKRTHPESQVTLLDKSSRFPFPDAAGHDLNKIIRAEYEDPTYMQLALEALELWRTDIVLKSYYHENGILFAGIKEPGEKMVKVLKEMLGVEAAQMITIEDAQKRFKVFEGAKWEGDEITTWNPRAGWADAADALQSVIQASIELGVESVSGSVRRVILDGDGICTGAETEDGQVVVADRIVLATGAYTPKILADSAPTRPEIHAGHRMVAAGACMGLYRVPSSEMWRFEKAPVCVNPVGQWPSETIPAGDKGLVKLTFESAFTNNVFHDASQQVLSIPPDPISKRVWSQDLPKALKEENMSVRDKMYGTWVNDLEPEHYRMCWDAITPTHDFLITSHEEAKNLYIAAGGSFHGYKFLANIGKYVVQMLDGVLDERLLAKWAWNRKDSEGAGMGMYIPRRDLKTDFD